MLSVLYTHTYRGPNWEWEHTLCMAEGQQRKAVALSFRRFELAEPSTRDWSRGSSWMSLGGCRGHGQPLLFQHDLFSMICTAEDKICLNWGD